MKEHKTKIHAYAVFMPVLIGTLLTACGGGSTTPPTPPAAPTNVVATAKPGYVHLTWKSDGTNLTGFDIFRETVPKALTQGVKKQALALLASVGSEARSFRDTQVTAGTQYRYAVAARGQSASSEQTPSLTVTPVLNTAPTTSGFNGLVRPLSSPDATLDLTQNFSDGQQPSNTLIYTVQANSNPAVATAMVTAASITVNFLTPGSTTFTLRATDAAGLFVETPLMVTVTQGSHPLTVAVSTGGRVESSPAGIQCPDVCTAHFPEGTVVTLKAVPDPDAVFLKWTGGCSGPQLTCATPMNAPQQVSAAFMPPTPVNFDIMLDATLLTVPSKQTRRFWVAVTSETPISVASFQVSLESSLVGLGKDQLQFAFLPLESTPELLAFELSTLEAIYPTLAPAVLTVKAKGFTRTVDLTVMVLNEEKNP